MHEKRVVVEAIDILSARYFVLQLRAPEVGAEVSPGQFLMVSTSHGIDPLLRRPMAFYGIQRDGSGEVIGFSILVEKTGRGTRLLAQLRPGDSLDILGPLGRPFSIGESSVAGAENLLVMGGVGAAPFPLLAAQLRRRGDGVRAFVGGRSAADVLCLADFAALDVPAVVSTDDGSAGHHGLVTEALEVYLQSTPVLPAAIYSCGPTPMMRAVDVVARRHGIGHQVSLEAPMACGIGVCLSCVVRVRAEGGWAYRRVCREGPVFDAAQLLWG